MPNTNYTLLEDPENELLVCKSKVHRGGYWDSTFLQAARGGWEVGLLGGGSCIQRMIQQCAQLASRIEFLSKHQSIAYVTSKSC